MKKLLAAIKKLLGQSSAEKGFTLIELLVVIGILGILAVGALIILNPVGQLNKAKDANAKSQMDQAVQTIQGYYASNQLYPTSFAVLTTSGELKSVPNDGSGNPDTYVTNVGNTAAAVYTNLLVNNGTNVVWCWRSSTGTTVATTVLACTAP